MNDQLANAILVHLLRAHGKAVTLSNAEIQVLALQDVRIEPLVTGDGVRVVLLGNDPMLKARLAWQDMQAARKGVRAAPAQARMQAMRGLELASQVYGKELVLIASRGTDAMLEHLLSRDAEVSEEELNRVYSEAPTE